MVWDGTDRRGTRRLRLTRSIMLSGEHADAGSIHDVPRTLAAHLIGEGSAVEHVEEGQKPEAASTSFNRMETPVERDPHTKQVAPAPPKVKAAK
jgi:hypothetical protein